ncbi:hypothetical protein EDB84DRAFT_1456666 [Lactarius hengduanensis]|nr:hypothetical protein EDB84DRAFT_1456666 [Lactarius hengduanensis]
MPPRSRKRRITSNSDASVLQHESNADAGAAAPTMQKRVSSERLRSVSSTSSLSSIDDSVSPLCSPQHHDTQQYKKAPCLHSPSQGRGTDSGPLVWVRVTKSGRPAPDDQEGSGESYWWPAHIMEGLLAAGPLTVSLYGEISPRAPQSIHLETPSPSHVLPFKRPGQDVIPFSPVTFRCRSGSPRRKYRRTAMDEAWRSAVDLAHEADANLNDGLPSNLSSYRVGTVPIHENDAERSMSKVKESTNGQTIPSGRWSPPPCDPLLEVPGELVYSLEKKGRSQYWAARVEQYVPPTLPWVPPKYRVRFKDDTFRTVTRDMFFTSDEPEFYTCSLGHWASDDEESEIDSGDEHVSWETVTVEHAMPPPNPDDFCELPIREQFAYIKPVIKAVLNETYLPARERHQAFMQGGPSRIRLLKTATGKGDLSAREVSQLGRVLQFWVLGPMRVQRARPQLLEDLKSESGQSSLTDVQVEQILCPPSPTFPKSTSGRETVLSPPPQSSFASSSSDIEPSEFIQQTGSPGYEALSESDKLQYCLLVLFHEATLQLLLWRSGERGSPDLLSQDEEARLRAIGLAKSEEKEWVEEISRMRGMRAKDRDSPSPVVDVDTDKLRSGRSLRPRTLSFAR